MRVAYVAGPYRGPTESAVVQNIRNAEAVAIELWCMGFAVVCPHKNTALLGGAIPDETVLAGDLEIMARCDLVVLVPGWEKSTGTMDEVKEACQIKMPVYRWPEQRAALEVIARS
jgi:hypothetical protein